MSVLFFQFQCNNNQKCKDTSYLPVVTWNQAHNNFTLFHLMLTITWWGKSYRYYLYF